MDKCVSEINQISFDCKYHKGFKPMLLSLSSYPQVSQDDMFLCNQCFNKKRYNQQKFEDYLFIDDLLSSNEKTILSKWPPLNNQELLFGINSLQEDENKCINHQKDAVLEYFDSLQQEINQHIDHVKKQMLIQCDKILELEEQFMKTYNKIAEKDRVKDLFMAPNLDSSQAITKIKEFLDLKNQQKEQNEELLMKVYTPYYQQLSSFDQQAPKILKETLIEMINSINFFPHLADKQENSSSNQEVDLSQKIKVLDLCQNLIMSQQNIELSEQTKFILELINNPSNNLRNEFKEKITIILKQLTPFFKDLDTSNCTNENKVSFNFHQLRKEQVELVEKLIQKMKQVEYSENSSNATLQSLPNTQFILKIFLQQIEEFEQLKLLLQHYPILELMKRDFSFMKGFYKDSQTNLQMTKLSNGVISFRFYAFTSGQYDNSILSNLYLEKKKTYKIQFEIKYCDKENYSYIVGLTSLGQTHQIGTEGLCVELNQKGINSGKGMDKVKIGNSSDFKNQRFFELVVNLQKGQLELADLPFYHNIIEISNDKKQQLQSNTLFQIGFSIHKSGDSLIIQNIQVINE